MRRHLDPLELEKLTRRSDDPLRTPLDIMAEFSRALFTVLATAVVGIVVIALTFSDIPGVSP